MNDEKMCITDDDFSSILSFKNGEVKVDSASAILLAGYFNDRIDWYYAIKERENREFEYRSYVEFSRNLLNQLMDFIHYYTLATDKESRIQIVNGMKIVCSQINSFCRGNVGGIVIGANLSTLTDAHLGNENHMDVWNKVIYPLQDDVIALRKQEESYYNELKESTKSSCELAEKNLPDEVKGASSEIVDIIKEKEENVKEFYDRVHINSAFQDLCYALSNGKAKDIKKAHKKILEQCRIVNECNASPFRGDLTPMFTFETPEDMAEYIKYGQYNIQAELINIDMIALGNKTGKLSKIKEDSYKYINSTINLSKQLGLISPSFDVSEVVEMSEEQKERMQEVLGPSL